MTRRRLRLPSHGVALAATAVAYCLCHHLGSLSATLGSAPRGTRVADWLDLLVPLLVLGSALVTLVVAQAGRATYLWFAVGAWLYTAGHGIHLAANSVWNADPGETARLWDEYVGHWVWYAGAAVVAGTLAATMHGRPRPANPLAWLLAVAVGLTWATNAVGGHFQLAGLVLAAVATGWGLRHRGDQAVLVAVAGLPGALLIASAWAFGWDFD